MHSLSVDDYEAMIFAGWRRSGQYLYRPDLYRACCQAHVIRLPAARYAASSTHKRVLKRLRRACTPAPPRDATTPPAAAAATAATSTAAPRARRAPGDDPASAAFAVEMRVAVSAALRRAADGSGAGGETRTVEPAIVEAACAAVKVLVRPPARPSERKDTEKKQKRRRKAVDGESVSGMGAEAAASVDPQAGSGAIAVEGIVQSAVAVFATNIALVVAGLERKRDGQAPEKSTERSMAVAEIVATELRSHGSSLGGAEIVCAAPGWINISIARSSLPNLVEDHVGPSADSSGFKDVAPTLGKSESGEASDSSSQKRSVLAEGSSTGDNTPSTAPLSGANTEGDDSSDAESESRSEGGSDEEGLKVMDEDESRHRLPPTDVVDLDPVAEGRSFSMEFVPSRFEEDEYRIYRAYQMAVHKSKESECKERSYRRFLVDSPLRHVRRRDGPPKGYGSFHIRYCLAGRLFAVGVVDVLPQSLSSVYLFFDPAYSALSPGVLSAVKEIEWVQQVSISVPHLQYYVMGYYIHTCPKMAYKARFKPSEIMCDETKHWVPADRATAILSAAEASGTRTTRIADKNATPVATLPPTAVNSMVSETVMELEDKMLVPFREIERVFGNRLGDMCAQLRINLARFIELVGAELSSKFTHKLR